jgi:Capsule polysaccharide biosynthesis protein
MSVTSQIIGALHQRLKRQNINLQTFNFSSKVSRFSRPNPEVKPVVIFNASTRLVGMSLNAAFSLLTGWALRLQNVPVVHFVCQAGMSRCVLGTDRTDPSKTPPCKACVAQSRWFYSSSLVLPFIYHTNEYLVERLRGLSLDGLMAFEFQLADEAASSEISVQSALPLGQLVLPSMRWVLRRHHLLDDVPTRSLYQKYILSAYHVAEEFSTLLDKTSPQAVVLFNGQFFPESTARWVAAQHGIRTITHEVGLQPFSAFFTPGEATAYPLHIPADFALSSAQDERLDAYLSQRFHGQFSMAGVRFWPEMKGLDTSFLEKAARFKQIVPVFTNVIFDTSQPHSNTVFPHMFAWLDQVLEIARDNPETLFVIRAHPDEARPGKASQESVSQWVTQNQADSLSNLVFVDSNQPLSSYELIQRSKFVMVYNSTIGLEASIMGMPVLCAGRARFTQLPTVFFPTTPEEYRRLADNFLTQNEISIPPEFQPNARRLLYYQLYRSSLPFSEYLKEDGIWPGFVRLKKFTPQSLSPTDSPAIKTILAGILEGGDFMLPSDL